MKMLQVDITCGFNHSNFPFDTQHCLFRYGVLDYEVHQVTFKDLSFVDWTNLSNLNPADEAQFTKLPFYKQIASLGERFFDFGGPLFGYTGLSLTFDRNPSKYIYGYYVPTSLFVVISWLSFVISHQQVRYNYYVKAIALKSIINPEN